MWSIKWLEMGDGYSRISFKTKDWIPAKRSYFLLCPGEAEVYAGRFDKQHTARVFLIWGSQENQQMTVVPEVSEEVALLSLAQLGSGTRNGKNLQELTWNMWSGPAAKHGATHKLLLFQTLQLQLRDFLRFLFQIPNPSLQVCRTKMPCA